MSKQTRSILEVNKSDILSRIKNGESVNSISEDYSVTNTLVRKKLFEWGKDEAPVPVDFDSRKDEIIRLKNEQGFSHKEIASELGIPYGEEWVYLFFKRHNIEAKRPQTVKREKKLQQLEDNKEKVVRLYKDNLNIKVVSDKLDVNHRLVSKKLNEWGVSRKDIEVEKFYALDEDEREDIIPDTYREVFDKIVFEDKKYFEVSEELGIPMGTVKSRYYRARRFLRNKTPWEEYRNDES